MRPLGAANSSSPVRLGRSEGDRGLDVDSRRLVLWVDWRCVVRRLMVFARAVPMLLGCLIGWCAARWVVGESVRPVVAGWCIGVLAAVLVYTCVGACCEKRS